MRRFFVIVERKTIGNLLYFPKGVLRQARCAIKQKQIMVISLLGRSRYRGQILQFTRYFYERFRIKNVLVRAVSFYAIHIVAINLVKFVAAANDNIVHLLTSNDLPDYSRKII